MTSILDLPNEILYRIFTFVSTQDIPSFALTNKAIHVLSGDAVKRFHDVRNRYAVLTLGDYVDAENYSLGIGGNGAEDAYLILEDIFTDSDVALFTKKVRIGQREEDIEDEEDDVDDGENGLIDSRRKVVRTHLSCIKDLLDSSRLVPEDVKETVLARFEDAVNQADAITILLLLLPNVESIVLQDGSCASFRLRSVVETVAAANRNPQSPDHGKSLNKLHEIFIEHEDTEMGEDVNLYGPFALLPSMRSLQGNQIDGLEFCWPDSVQSHISSLVTDINIELSAVSSDAFGTLLDGIAALKHFRYHHVGAMTGDSYYDVSGIVEALRRNATHSLSTLEIEAMDSENLNEDEQEQCIGSLKMFSCLRSIRLEDMVFRKNPDEMGRPRTLSVGASYGQRQHMREKDCNMSRLIDVLPASTKGLTLISTMSDEEVWHMLQGLAEGKNDMLPLLKRITFECDDPLMGDMKASLGAKGIRLMSWKNPL